MNKRPLAIRSSGTKLLKQLSVPPEGIARGLFVIELDGFTGYLLTTLKRVRKERYEIYYLLVAVECSSHSFLKWRNT